MENQKIPLWFWIVAVIALLWNIIGVLSYLSQAYMTEEMLAQMPQNQIELIKSRPAWATAAFAIAVFSGFLGSIFLLMRKGVSINLFIISFFAIIAQQIQAYFMTNSYEVYGAGGLTLALMILIIGALMIYIAKKAKLKGWMS